MRFPLIYLSMQLLSLLCLLHTSLAFVVVGKPRRIQTTTTTQVSLAPQHVAASLIVATIDSDIANIPTNEFAPIFAGGIAVMFGGLLSTLVLGFLVDKKDLYGELVVDSFSQADGEKAFWEGMSAEDREKTMELMERMKKSREEGIDVEDVLEEAAALAGKSEGEKESPLTDRIPSKNSVKDLDMFSDY